MYPYSSRHSHSWLETIESQAYELERNMYNKIKNKVSAREKARSHPAKPQPPPPVDDIESLKEKAELAVEYGNFLVEMRHSTLDALDPTLKFRLFQLKSEKSWGTRELLGILVREYATARDHLKVRDSQWPSVRSLLSIGGGQDYGDDDPYLQALRQKEGELKRNYDEAWNSRAQEMERRHKLAIQTKNKELDRVERELNHSWGSSLEALKVQHHRDKKAELDDLNARWVTHVDELKVDHSVALQSKDGELATIEDRVNQRWQQTINELNFLIDQLKKEMSTAEHKHVQDLHTKDGHHKYEYDLLAAAKVSGEAAHETELQTQQTNYEGQLRQQQRNHIDKVQKLKDDHLEKQTQLETRSAAERDRLKDTIKDLKKQHADDLSELKLTHAREIGKIDDEHEAVVTQLKTQRDQIEKKTKLEWQEDVKRLKQEWQDDVKGLKQNIESVNKILFARERFTPMPDRVLGEKFSSLVHDVQNLARQTWRSDQLVWSDSVMRSVTKNPPRLREQLLQDGIWWILHDCVFCSPFRMFGDEGRLLEERWNTACGRDSELQTGEYTWPRPALETERWRWEAVKQCQTALKEPASHLDPRAQIKKGFKESRDNLIKTLRAAVSEVARADQGVMSDIEKLVKKAINVWLDFEIQRCRLMMTMPTEKIDSEEGKVELARQKRLELTSLPGLVRFGDDSGQDLTIRQTVGSCDPDTVRVS